MIKISLDGEHEGPHGHLLLCPFGTELWQRNTTSAEKEPIRSVLAQHPQIKDLVRYIGFIKITIFLGVNLFRFRLHALVF